MLRNIVAKYLEKVGMEHPSPEALKQYLKDHPNADPKNHTVSKGEGGGAHKLPEPPGRMMADIRDDFGDHYRSLDRIDEGGPNQVDAMISASKSNLSVVEDTVEKFKKHLKEEGGHDDPKVKAVEKALGEWQKANKTLSDAFDEEEFDTKDPKVQAVKQSTKKTWAALMALTDAMGVKL